MIIEIISLIIMICVFSLLFTGIYLLFRMRTTKMYNLSGLILFFFLYDLQLLGGFIFPSIFYVIMSQICIFFLLLFIKYTFYKETKSLFTYLLIVFIVSKIIGAILSYIYGFRIPLVEPISTNEIPLFNIYKIVIIFQVSPAFLWLAYASLNTLNKLKKHDIEPWIKRRYQIIGYSSLFFVLNNLSTIFMPTVAGYENVPISHVIFIASAFIIFSFGNLIAWVMPRKLKEYFNRNYESVPEELASEEEIINKIKQELDRGDFSG